MSEPASPRDVIECLIQGISKGGWLELHELYAEDAVVEYPFALPAGPARLAGRPAIRRYFAAVARLPLELKARHIMLHETRDPEVDVMRRVAESAVCASADGVAIPVARPGPGLAEGGVR